MAGALDGLPGSRAVLMATVDRALEVAARYQEDKSKGQMSLFDMGGADSSISNIAEVLEEAEEWGSVEMLNKEREVLGLCLSGHPLDEFRPELIGFTTCSLSQEELARKEGCVVAVGGIVTRMRSIETKRGATIGFGEMQDFQGEVGLFFKKDTWESFRDKISEDDRILVKGTLEYQRDRDKNITEQMQVVVEEAYQLDYVRERMVKYIHANIYSSMLSEEFLQKLEMGMQQFEAFEGEPGSELVLHIETESSYEHGLTLHKYKLSYSQDVLNWLKQDMGASKVWVSGKPRR
jgi:DNA polymerase-3 subunit alpha